ncbi:Clp protease N-terminal domain-containing protein [uncultured Pseudokineococcus sp.]|uniref:Clp protease N-terminal domain-containing protein n=1 Tax=uncultured Pseudokineococcus sp. TaxID=1642928 RepID=UPI0026283A32|nr:hypothetical protein [uncultured Pseudokineococcus sp.]
MLFYDETFSEAMTAGGREAELAGRRAMGTEHLLLGLLIARGPLVDPAVRAAPALSEHSVRQAIERGLDDLPYLHQLGIDPDRVLASAGAPSASHLLMSGSHTNDLQAALEAASLKLHQLRKSGALPRERKVTSAVAWMTVLEPTTRVSRLLAAMDVDADHLRDALLGALVVDGAPTPPWPERARPGVVNRGFQRLFRRLDVAS